MAISPPPKHSDDSGTWSWPESARSRKTSSNKTSGSSRWTSLDSKMTSLGSKTSWGSMSTSLRQRSPRKVTKSTSSSKQRRRCHSGRKSEKAELDPDDFDGAIVRCKARIKKGKDVELHKDHSKILEAYKKEKDAMMAKWPGLSYSIATRLEFFKSLKTFLKDEGDKNKVLSNVNSIMKAYKSGDLQWQPGYVTYWSYGKQLTQPREFDWAEFIYWNFHNEGSKGFWVEGLRDTAGHVRRFWKRTVCWPARYTGSKAEDTFVKVPIAFRFPGPPPEGSGLADFRTTVDPQRPTEKYPSEHMTAVPRAPVRSNFPTDEQGPEQSYWTYGPHVDRETVRYSRNSDSYSVLWMNDDTGSDICTITEADLDTLREHASSTNEPLIDVPLLGYVSVQGAVGKSRFEEVRALEINLCGSGGSGPPMIKGEWEIIEVAIAPNPEKETDEPVRLVGPWLRHRFFTATAPDRTGRLWIVKKHRRLANVGGLLGSVRFDDSGLLPVKTMRHGAVPVVRDFAFDPIRRVATR